jgi:hypothetical protein
VVVRRAEEALPAPGGDLVFMLRSLFAFDPFEPVVQHVNAIKEE